MRDVEIKPNAKTITIHEGFKHLTNQRGWYKKCRNDNKALKVSTANSFKKLFKDGSLSDSKIIELLRSAGYVIIPPKCMIPDE